MLKQSKHYFDDGDIGDILAKCNELIEQFKEDKEVTIRDYFFTFERDDKSDKEILYGRSLMAENIVYIHKAQIRFEKWSRIFSLISDIKRDWKEEVVKIVIGAPDESGFPRNFLLFKEDESESVLIQSKYFDDEQGGSNESN